LDPSVTSVYYPTHSLNIPAQQNTWKPCAWKYLKCVWFLYEIPTVFPGERSISRDKIVTDRVSCLLLLLPTLLVNKPFVLVDTNAFKKTSQHAARYRTANTPKRKFHNLAEVSQQSKGTSHMASAWSLTQRPSWRDGEAVPDSGSQQCHISQGQVRRHTVLTLRALRSVYMQLKSCRVSECHGAT